MLFQVRDLDKAFNPLTNQPMLTLKAWQQLLAYLIETRLVEVEACAPRALLHVV